MDKPEQEYHIATGYHNATPSTAEDVKLYYYGIREGDGIKNIHKIAYYLSLDIAYIRSVIRTCEKQRLSSA